MLLLSAFVWNLFSSTFSSPRLQMGKDSTMISSTSYMCFCIDSLRFWNELFGKLRIVEKQALVRPATSCNSSKIFKHVVWKISLLVEPPQLSAHIYSRLITSSFNIKWYSCASTPLQAKISSRLFINLLNFSQNIFIFWQKAFEAFSTNILCIHKSPFCSWKEFLKRLVWKNVL